MTDSGKRDDFDLDSGVPEEEGNSTSEETNPPSHDEFVLQHELETFEQHFVELLAHSRGRFALIKGNHVVDTYESKLDAIRKGYEMFGNVPFLVKQVLEIDAPLNFVSGL